MAKRIGVICGGSGSSKFAIGLSEAIRDKPDIDVGFISNVADNFWHHGLYVCPDVDIMTYALSSSLDESKGWGVYSDTFNGKDALSALSSVKEWFSLGDKDTSLAILRTELMKKGWRLGQITKLLCKRLKVSQRVIPATDDPVQTFIHTTSLGSMHLQEFWVKNKGDVNVSGVEYLGLSDASPDPDAIDYCAKNTVIFPANPVTSILPTVRMRGFANKLRSSRVIAISPFLGDNRPFSGPAGKLLTGLGTDASSFGVAKLYSKFLKLFFVDNSESPETVEKIEDELGIECEKTNTRVKSRADGQVIARQLLDSL